MVRPPQQEVLRAVLREGKSHSPGQLQLGTVRGTGFPGAKLGGPASSGALMLVAHGGRP